MNHSPPGYPAYTHHGGGEAIRDRRSPLMVCRHCGGLLWDYEDDLGPRCLQCGRSPEPPPTLGSLKRDGLITSNVQAERSGSHRRGVEFQPSNGDITVLRRFKSR